MVEHHLAKVRVAGSNPVVRSEAQCLTVEWPRGEATACKAVYTGSNPVSTSRTSGQTEGFLWTIGAAVARFPDTEEVTGSIPVSPTTKPLVNRVFSCPKRRVHYAGKSANHIAAAIGDYRGAVFRRFVHARVTQVNSAARIRHPHY